jgi:hypothetical protein
MATVAMTVEGVEQILLGFSRLSKSVQRKYLGAAVRQVVKDAVPQVKALTPRGPTGNLRRSVGLKLEKKKKNTTVTGIVGYRAKGGGNRNELGFHAWWVENGVRDRYPNGRALSVPLRLAAKYPYMKGNVSLIGGDGGGAIFFKSVRGYTGSDKFRQWSESNLPRMKQELVGRLEQNLGTAIAEEERRLIRKIRNK